MCGLGKLSDGAKFKSLKKNPDNQKILEELNDGKKAMGRKQKEPIC